MHGFKFDGWISSWSTSNYLELRPK